MPEAFALYLTHGQRVYCPAICVGLYRSKAAADEVAGETLFVQEVEIPEDVLNLLPQENL